MALKWDLSKIENFEEVCLDNTNKDEVILRPVTQTVIWLSLFIGMDEITEKNYKQFATRTKMYERCLEPLMRTKDAPLFMSKEEIKKHIGLTTNAERYSDARFLKILYNNVFREGK